MIAIPLSTAAREIAPVYWPAASAAEFTVTVKVAEAPLATVAEAGDIDSHDPPLDVVAVGVIVTPPVHAPMTPMVKFCAAGLLPASLAKVSPVTEGGCKVQGG